MAMFKTIKDLLKDDIRRTLITMLVNREVEISAGKLIFTSTAPNFYISEVTFEWDTKCTHWSDSDGYRHVDEEIPTYDIQLRLVGLGKNKQLVFRTITLDDIPGDLV